LIFIRWSPRIAPQAVPVDAIPPAQQAVKIRVPVTAQRPVAERVVLSAPLHVVAVAQAVGVPARRDALAVAAPAMDALDNAHQHAKRHAPAVERVA